MTNITEIIEKTKELGQLLKDSDQVIALSKAKADYDQNAEIQELMAQFNMHKMSIAALSKQENPDEERIADHEDKLRQVYDKIMESDVMSEYQLKSQAVEALVVQVNNIINFYISGEEPQSCSGSCSTCGGCSGK